MKTPLDNDDDNDDGDKEDTAADYDDIVVEKTTGTHSSIA